MGGDQIVSTNDRRQVWICGYQILPLSRDRKKRKRQSREGKYHPEYDQTNEHIRLQKDAGLIS